MRWILAAVVAIGMANGGANGVAAADLAGMFASRPAARQVALSPDGSKVVYIGALGAAGLAVTVADVVTGKSAVVLGGSDLSTRPVYCAFKTDARIICRVYGVIGSGVEKVGYTRSVAVDTDGKNLRLIGESSSSREQVMNNGSEIIDWLPDDPGHVLMRVVIGHTYTGNTNIRPEEPGVGAALVDVKTGSRRMVERSDSAVTTLGTDSHGNIRFRGLIQRDVVGYVKDNIAYFVRPKTGKDWLLLARTTLLDQSAVSFDGFDESGDNVFVLKPLNGRQALYSVAADAAKTDTLVFAHDKVDVDGVLRIGKYNRPVAASYTVERDGYEFFDAKLAALGRSLSKALPGQPAVSVLDESWDGSKKLVYADSDNTPGRYYLFDSATKQLNELLSVYPALDGVTMGEQRAIDYAARDGTRIPGYLTLPPGKTSLKGLPAIVMPHGGPSARDTAGFDWLAQFYAARGYAVLQPNYRGSSGYGSDFFAKNGFQSWALAIGDVNDGARWLAAQGADAGKLAIVGWSYGGYAALQANVVEPNLYKAAVAIAPVTDLALLREGARNYTNFKLVDAMIGNGPHVLAGSPARNAGAIRAPVLIFHADKDLNVDISQSRAMASSLKRAGKSVELIEYKGLDHQIDDSLARRDMLGRSADFLDKMLK